jgi:hypothetical protein
MLDGASGLALAASRNDPDLSAEALRREAAVPSDAEAAFHGPKDVREGPRPARHRTDR